MKAHPPRPPALLCAALLAVPLEIGACGQTEAEVDAGVCGSTGSGCGSSADCCEGFSCQAKLCVFTGIQSGGSSGGNSSGLGGSSSGGSSSGSGSSSSGSSSGDFVTAPHGVTQVPFQGGATLGNPVLVTITFQDDPNRADVEQFGKFLVGSKWYSQISPQFKLGPASEVNVELAQNAPATIDDSTIQANLATLIEAGTAPGLDGGVSLSNAIYMAYYPSTTSITLSQGGQSVSICEISSGGYHSQAALSSGQPFAYGVITNCPGQLPVASPENLEWAASHEFIEASTDPFPEDDPGWLITSDTNPWAAIGGEVADLCTGIFPQWSEGSYGAINRVWSDGSAADGGDPCLPEPDPYFSTDLEPQAFVAVAAGSSTTFKVTGWSTAPMPSWQIYAAFYEGSFQSTVSLSTNSIGNGQTATLTVMVPANASTGDYSVVEVLSGTSQNDFTSTIAGVYVP